MILCRLSIGSLPAMPKVPIQSESSFPEGKPVQISYGTQHVVVMKIDGEYHAMNDVCPHRGAFIGSGPVAGSVLTCPWHDWSFDITTGECLTNPNAMQQRYPVEVVEGMVVVELPEELDRSELS